MQNLTITRTNGNIVRSLAGEDHISGLVFYSATLPTATEGVDGFTATERIHAISSPETAEKYGITADAEAWETRVLHYTLASIFNMNPGVSLYVGIFKPAAGTNAFSEIKQIQNHAGGRLRQVGVWNGAVELSDTLVNSLQSVRTTLEAQNKPLSILYAPKVSDVTALPSDLAKIGRNGVSVIIGQEIGRAHV